MRHSTDWIDDLPTLLRLARLVDAADPDGLPRLDLVFPDRTNGREASFAAPRRLAFLAGSFNPPHTAHLAIARAALDAGLERVVFALSKRTVDKTAVTGLGLADRLLILRRLAAEESRARGVEPAASPLGVALVNRGLYVDQAEVFRQAFPTLDELHVVLGFDKIVQVIDPRYYEDRDAALERLFALADVYVAPRAGADADDLGSLLARPENRRFAERVKLLPIPPDLAHVSSSDAREAGESAEGLPPTVREFVRHTGAFAPPGRQPDGEEVDAYAVRLALVDALGRGVVDPTTAALLLERILAEGSTGRAARAWLADPTRDLPADLRAELGGAA